MESRRYENKSWRDGMRLRFDFNNMMADAVGAEYGFTPADLDGLADAAAKAVAGVKKARDAGELEWADLPYSDEVTADVLDFAAGARERFRAFVILGIGGSALGPTALQTSLNHLYYNMLPEEKRPGPLFFVLDNVDPAWMNDFMDVVDPAETCFNVISKSGGTAETMAQFITFRDMLVSRLGDSHVDHVVATTSADRGVLKPIADEAGYRTFIIPEKVGGRFSVLSPVGLVGAAVCGIDIRELLAGAAYADTLCREADPWKNMALANALLQWQASLQGKRISVMMPYSQRLRDIADWYRQLWAESLGKKLNRAGRVVNAGPTPIKALGVTDQHSQVQLYMEGPYDKVIDFLLVEDYGRDLEIPAGPEFADVKALGYLGGHTFSELIKAEAEATALALAENGRLNCAHVLPEVNPFTVGQLLYVLEMQTAFSGELYDINAFDQPGVEAGKINTYGLMGRIGYEARGREIEHARAKKQAGFVI